MKNTLLVIISLIVSFEAMAWSVDDSIDNMSGKSIREANALSENQVDLGWPYGIMRGNLSVRIHPRYGRDIIFFLISNKRQLVIPAKVGIKSGRMITPGFRLSPE